MRTDDKKNVSGFAIKKKTLKKKTTRLYFVFYLLVNSITEFLFIYTTYLRRGKI